MSNSNSKQAKAMEPAPTGMLATITTSRPTPGATGHPPLLYPTVKTISTQSLPRIPQQPAPGNGLPVPNLLKEALDSWDAFVLKYPKGIRPDTDDSIHT